MEPNDNSVPLSAHIQAIFAERDKRHDQRFEDLKQSLIKADQSLREYKASANEFRGTLQDQALQFMPRQESENTAKELRNLIDAQAKLIVSLQMGESRGLGGSAQKETNRATSLAVIGLAITVGLAALSGIGGLMFYLFTTARH